MANLYDTHLHLDLQRSKEITLAEIDSNKIYTIAVTNLPPLYEKLSKEINSKYVRVSLGFHPELIGQYHKYIPEMWRLLPDAKYIGEVGIDSKMGKDTKSMQISFFEELVYKCSEMGNKILSVHSRASSSDVISIIGNNFNGKAILHWYSGTKQNQEKAIQNGFYFSVNYAMLNSESGKKIIANIPDNKILIETDSPFVSLSSNCYTELIKKTIEGTAAIRGVSPEMMQNIFWNNFKTLLVSPQ